MRNALELWRGALNNPWKELGQLQREIDRIWDDFPGAGKNGRAVAFAPTCDVSENKEEYLFSFDLPGLSKDQIKIELNENQLTVSGERQEEHKEDSKKRHLTEKYYGAFMRSFTLPASVDSTKVDAQFKDGVLTVRVPKSVQAKARQITVK